MTYIILNIIAILVYWWIIHSYKHLINNWLDLNTRVIQCDCCRCYWLGVPKGVLISLLICQVYFYFQ